MKQKNFSFSKIILTLALTIFSFIYSSAQVTVTVAKDGTGKYSTLKDAINAYPASGITAANPYVIMISKGFYFEKDTIASTRPYIQIIGTDVANTIIAYNAAAGLVPPSGSGTYGTAGSATLTINATDFTAENITVVNTFNYDSAATAGFTGSQAVAIQINADRAAFKNCRFLGDQDTMYAKGTLNARQYFKNCYIDGIVDFIFGSSVAVFDSCIIYGKTRTATGGSYLTAANTTSGQAFGYVFKDCKIPANTGTTPYALGRPWGNATGVSTGIFNRVVYLNTTMGYTVNPVGWSLWDAGTITDSIYDAEYKSKNTDGSLANVSSRIAWSHQMTNADTVGYNLFNMLRGWDPNGTRSDFASYQDPGIVVSNFKGKKGATVSNFTWNISWAKTGITYVLYRSTDKKATFSSIGQVVAANDTAINFALTDAFPPAGSVYYYYLKASLTGNNNYISDTIAISSAPTITALGTLGSFIQSIYAPASPSAFQYYTVAAVNLVDSVRITPPAPFEISVDTINWIKSTGHIALAATSGTLNTTKVFVRLNGSAAGNYSDSIVHATTGTGANNAKLAVTGTITTQQLIIPVMLQQWPMNTDNKDSAGSRSAAVTASTPVFKNFVVSNGTKVPGLTAYSVNYGQAFAPVDSGLWKTPTGPSSKLNRSFYEQFTMTVAPGYSARIDSLIFYSGFYASSSGTKVAVVYSLSGFASDSTDFPGASFASPVALPSITTASANIIRLAINGGSGDTLASGKTITLRFYFCCGSTSTGRYGMIQNVCLKGLPIGTVNTVSIQGNIWYPNMKVIPNTKVMLSGAGLDSTLVSGTYTLNEPSGGNYTIRVTKNNDVAKANGVTAVDLALIQSHILGKNPLNSKYKYIAADVNGDGSITAVDLVYIKRLILGIDSVFPVKKLWVFVDSSYIFPDTTHPSPLKDSISIIGLSVNKLNQTFIGIKLGDVNWDWNPVIAKPAAKSAMKLNGEIKLEAEENIVSNIEQ